MREVKFKRFIAPVYKDMRAGYKQAVSGTGCYEKDFSSSGIFLDWGVKIFPRGSFTCAIVELEDGTIDLVQTQNIKFVK